MCAAGAAELYAARIALQTRINDKTAVEASGIATPALCEQPGSAAASILASRPKPPPLEIV